MRLHDGFHTNEWNSIRHFFLFHPVFPLRFSPLFHFDVGVSSFSLFFCLCRWYLCFYGQMLWPPTFWGEITLIPFNHSPTHLTNHYSSHAYYSTPFSYAFFLCLNFKKREEKSCLLVQHKPPTPPYTQHKNNLMCSIKNSSLCVRLLMFLGLKKMKAKALAKSG